MKRSLAITSWNRSCCTVTTAPRGGWKADGPLHSKHRQTCYGTKVIVIVIVMVMVILVWVCR